MARSSGVVSVVFFLLVVACAIAGCEERPVPPSTLVPPDARASIAPAPSVAATDAGAHDSAASSVTR